MPRGPKPLKKRMRADEFYCVGCRKKVRGRDIYLKKYNNKRTGRKVTMKKATCPSCNGTLNKIVKG